MERIDDAFRMVPRKLFLPAAVADQADEDRPLPIGYGQTNSQPTTVRLMLQWLDPQAGDRVLDVGSGSGWTTGLLAHLVGASGQVIAVEKIPELVAMGAYNCRRAGITNAVFHEAEQDVGWPPSAPYDRILVSAAADELPAGLIEQLSSPGRLVIPVRSSVLVVNKDSAGQLAQTEHRGFAFVPLL